jgi:hypothetical protein
LSSLSSQVASAKTTAPRSSLGRESLRHKRLRDRTLLSRVDHAFSSHFGLVVAGLIVVPVLAFSLLLSLDAVTLDNANKFMDSVVKVLVAAVGAAWALNRYFVGRVDAPQVRLEPKMSLVSTRRGDEGGSSNALLLYRVNIVNAGRVQLRDYTLALEIAALRVNPVTGELEYDVLGGLERHEGGPIEPGSWAAVSDALLVPHSLKAVRAYVEIHRLNGPGGWTWHELVDLTKGSA